MFSKVMQVVIIDYPNPEYMYDQIDIKLFENKISNFKILKYLNKNSLVNFYKIN